MGDSKERTAYHEAAHGVVASALGFVPVLVRIRRDKGSGGWQSWEGETKFASNMSSRVAQQHVAVAGFLAEAKWHSAIGSAACMLDENAGMDSFLDRLRTWQKYRVAVRVPVVVDGRRIEEEVMVFDEDLRFLASPADPLNERAVVGAIRSVRRILNNKTHWSRVVALARRLLDGPPRPCPNGESVEVDQEEITPLLQH